MCTLGLESHTENIGMLADGILSYWQEGTVKVFSRVIRKKTEVISNEVYRMDTGKGCNINVLLVTSNRNQLKPKGLFIGRNPRKSPRNKVKG